MGRRQVNAKVVCADMCYVLTLFRGVPQASRSSSEKILSDIVAKGSQNVSIASNVDHNQGYWTSFRTRAET
jgi:hypothetical protein